MISAALARVSAGAATPSIIVKVDTAPVAAARHEVVPLDEAALGDALRAGALRAGLAVNGPDAAPVVVRVTAYRSGARFGGSKTATIAADVLVRGSPAGTIDCTHTAKLDLRSSEKRNATAVDGCLADLGQAFGGRLMGVMKADGK